MPRPNRICFPGALYHIVQRGNNKQDIFMDDTDRWRFLKFLLDAKKRFNYIIHCYTLMKNHFHLTVETPNATPISRIMHFAEGGYSLFFNKRHARAGHLFQGRFKAILVEKDAYLMELSRYLHLNPVRAGLVASPESYKWSSYNVYTGARRDILVDTKAVLGCFGNAEEEAVRRYKNFVESGIADINNQGDWLEKNVKRGAFLGSKDFIKKFQKKCQAPY